MSGVRRLGNIVGAVALTAVLLFGAVVAVNWVRGGGGATSCPAPYRVQWSNSSATRAISWNPRTRYFRQPYCVVDLHPCKWWVYSSGQITWNLDDCDSQGGGGGGDSW